MPVVGLAEILVSPVFSGVQQAISKNVGPASQKAGRDAGKSMGKGMAEGLSSETGGLEAEVSRLGKSVADAETKVAAAKAKSEAATQAQNRALSALNIVELKLQETRDSGRAKASQLAAAEDRVATARTKVTSAMAAQENAESALTRSTSGLSKAQQDSSRASADLESHMRRVTTESANTERGIGRLGAMLGNAFRGRPLAGMAASIRGDSDRISFDLTKMSRDVSQAGTRGGRAFTAAFVGVVGGLSAVIPAAGAAGSALLAGAGNVLTLAASLGQLAGVAALVPAGLIAIGAGAGVLKAAFSGIGGALKAATEAAGTLAGATANPRLAAMAVEDAMDAIAQAEQNAADSQVDAARRVEDAKRSLQDTVEAVTDAQAAAAEAEVQAARQVEEAQRSLGEVRADVADQAKAAAKAVEMAQRAEAKAARGVLDAEKDLADARDEAQGRVREAGRAKFDADRDAVDSALAYKKAYELYRTAADDPSTSADELTQLNNNVAKAMAVDDDARKAVIDLSREHKVAQQEAKSGSEAVFKAEQKLADARQAEADAIQARKDAQADAIRQQEEGALRIADAQQGITDALKSQEKAQADSAKTAEMGARQVADAQQSIADATKDAERAQVDSAKAVEQANRNLERVQMQQADTAEQAGSKSTEAMDKLTPAARTAVGALLAVYEQLGNIRRIAQEGFFTGFAGPLLALAGTVMPQLATGVGAIASALGTGAQQIMTSLTAGLGGGVLDALLQGVATSISILNGAIDPLIQSFITLGVVGMEYMPALAAAIVDMATRFDAFVQQAAADGSLNTFIDNGIQAFRDLGTVIGATVGIFGALTAAARAGGIEATLGGLAAGLTNIRTIMEGPVFQTTMATLFAGAAAGSAGLLAALTPIGEAFRVGAGAMAEFLRLGGEISGTFIGGIFTALSNPEFGSGLILFMEALQRGVENMVPLMPQLTGAFGLLLTAMAPIVEVLGPSLIQVFTAFATGIAGLLTVLNPLLVAIAGSPIILGLLIGAFVATAAASAALTLAGNVQRIAMAAWTVATWPFIAVQKVLASQWLATAAAAVLSGAQTAYVWLLYKADAVKGAAAFAVEKAKIVAGWVLMAAQAVASGIKTAAVWTGTIVAQAVSSTIAFGVQVAKVVAGWVLMGAQSLLAAAKVALAWLIAMGPIGLVIAAVIGLVALIIANWDTITRVTTELWEKHVKPVLEKMGKFFTEDLPRYVRSGVTAFMLEWNKLKDEAKKPVRFVVDTVMGGLVNTFNDAFGTKIKPPKLPDGFQKGGYTGDGAAHEYAGPAHRGEFYFTKKETAAIGVGRLSEMASAAVRGGAATAGEGNMGGFFTGNANAVARHGAYYMQPNATTRAWDFPAAAKMWDGAAGVKVKMGTGNLQARVGPLERGGQILGYTTGNNIDMSPTWAAQLGLAQRRTTAAHEIGHALGLPHNSRNSIMQPNLGNMASVPTPLDIRNLQSLYPGGSGKAGEGGSSNPFDGIVDLLMGKIKEAFPKAGMFVDAAGGLAKTGMGQVVKWITDIKDGIKNIAGNVVGSIKDFFGGGAATGEPTLLRDTGGILPPGVSRILNNTGQNEMILNPQQMRDVRSLATSRSETSNAFPSSMRLVVDGREFTAYVDQRADRVVDQRSAETRYTRVGR